jgi:penicillin-binding protein
LADAVGIGNSSGGSTVTQQLVKQQVLSSEATFKRKVNEILIAKQIEKSFSKDEILTTYLNVSPFGRNHKGENIAGVEEAALGIFGKKALKLSVPQAAFIAGLPQSPIVYSPYDGKGKIKSDKCLKAGLNRQKQVLFNLYRNHYINKKEYESAKAYDLKQDFISHKEAERTEKDHLYYTVFKEATDVLADELAKQDGVCKAELRDVKIYRKYIKKSQERLQQAGLKVTTTISEPVYQAMQDAVARFGYILDERYDKTVEVGNVLIDNATGAILGFVGGRDYSTNKNNHAFDTERSPGSSIKPLLVYGPGIESGLIGSESKISNFPAKYASGQDIVHLESKGTDEYMSVRQAISESWNIPAHWLYQTLCSQNQDPASYMKMMNYSIADYGIESLPMGGGAEVSVAQQINGFQMLANGGVYHKKYLIENITDGDGRVLYQHKTEPVTVFTKATASIMNDLMREVINGGKTTQFKSFLEGIAPNVTQGDWIGKTGTSDEYKDAWLVISTPKVTLSSWSGYDDNQAMGKSSGYTNSSQYMAYLVSAIHSADVNILGLDKKFILDSSVIKSTVKKATGQKPGMVKVDEKKVEVPGDTVTSFFAKKGAKDAAYKFGIGGSDENYKEAWKRILVG